MKMENNGMIASSRLHDSYINDSFEHNDCWRLINKLSDFKPINNEVNIYLTD